MKVNKSILGGSICAITIFLTQIFLREIDGTKYSTQISVTVLLLIGVSIFIFSVVESIDIIMSATYPNILRTNPLLSNILDLSALGSFIAFIICIITAASITAKKNIGKTPSPIPFFLCFNDIN